MPKIKVENVGIWEEMYNPDFNSPEFGGIMAEAGTNRFLLSVKQWIERTNACGIVAKAGRYGGTYSDLVGAIGGLLERARERIATTANTTLVETYWNTGRYIVEYEQHGADRAKYGSRLLSTLARDLTLKHGSGFNRNNLQYMRKLYRAFPICTTLSCKLSWSHRPGYGLHMAIFD